MLTGAVELFDVDHLFDDLEIIFTKKATNTHTAGSDAGTTAHALMLHSRNNIMGIAIDNASWAYLSTATTLIAGGDI